MEAGVAETDWPHDVQNCGAKPCFK